MVSLQNIKILKSFYLERLLAILSEHGDHGIQNDLGLGQVGAGALDQDLRRVQGDLGVLPVDDRGHGEDDILGVVDDGVDGAVTDDGQVLLQVAFFLKTGRLNEKRVRPEEFSRVIWA